ncbi:MAG: NAD-dependent epimerase/dehydratase family protein [bacterium]
MKKIKVILTGSRGFIGRNTLTFFKTKKKYELCPISCRSGKEIKLPKAEAVIHLGGRVHEHNAEEKEYFRDNVDTSINLAKKAIQAGIQTFIFISTIKVYGEAEGHYSEKSACHPIGAYAKSKYQAEQALTRLFQKEKDKTLVILRLPLVYGMGQKGNMRRLDHYAKKGWPLPLKAATQKRSFLYVKNFCAAVEIILGQKHLKEGIYNISDPTTLSSKELYQACVKIYGKKEAIVFPFPKIVRKLLARYSKRAGYLVQRLFQTYTLNNQKFENEFNTVLPYTTHKGLKETLINKTD